MTHTIRLDREGLSIDDRPLFMLAGQLHYFRYPRGEWRDLLLKARAGGINTIDTVIPWNLHEPIEGRFDWSDEADLPGFLDLCAELGLRAIVRPGPYICAEWENGGFPAWLTAKPDLQLRVDHPVFLQHTLRWFDRLFPLLAPRQASRGGPIILCQIENEHWASGRYGHDDHQTTLAQAAIERGIDVPQYTCMGGHRDWPEFRNGWSGIAEKLQQTRSLWPNNPMIVSELWSGWFDNWGASRHNHKTAARLDTVLHQLMAVGASGLSHWMWAGGTNFGFWGGRTVGGDTIHMTTSYDYDAPVSEYGGLTPKYYVARRHHLFMGTLGASLAPIVADAIAGGPTVIAPAAVAGRGEAGAVPYRNVRARSDAPAPFSDLTATFLQNTTSEGQTYQLFLKQPNVHLSVEVEAGAIKPIFTHLPLGDSDLRLAFHTARVLGFWQREDADILVCYGSEGEATQIAIQAQAEQTWQIIDDGGARCDVAGNTLRLRGSITDRPTVARARAKRDLVLVVLSQARAERWWPVSNGFVCGPDLVIEDRGAIEIERRGAQPFYRITSRGEMSRIAFPASGQTINDPVAWGGEQLKWSHHDVIERASNDDWNGIEQPLAMEELGCHLGYGWYRAEFSLDRDREIMLTAPWLSDRARVLLDGQDVGWLGVHPDGARMTLPITIAAGAHDLRLLVDNLGRFNYGSNTGERKGLLDTLYLHGVQHDLTGGWSALWQEAVFAGEAIAGAHPAYVRPDATDISLDNFAFHGPSVWLLRAIETKPDRRYVLLMTGDRNPGALFVNGANATRFSRHYGGGYMKQDITDLLKPGENVLALNIQNYAGLPWRATLLEYDPASAIDARWSFRAGVGGQGSGIGDVILKGDARSAPTVGARRPAPVFHRATFAYDPAIHGAGPFKLALHGLDKGQISLNGHNVGRFWQTGPQEYYKLPASWLKPENELLIFDETGGSPDAVWIGVDVLGSNQRIASDPDA